MQHHIVPADQKQLLESVVNCYCELLIQADVSSMDSQRRDQVEPQSFIGGAQDNKKKAKTVVVSQENEIAQLIDGLKKILTQCLDLKTEDVILNNEPNDLRQSMVLT